MKTLIIFRSFVLPVFVLFITTINLQASETYRAKGDTLRYLKLTHLKTGDTIMLKTGEFIKVVYDKRMYGGTIDSIRENSFYMGGKEYELKKLSYILVNHRYMELKRFARVYLWITIGYAILTAILMFIFLISLLTYSNSAYYLMVVLGIMLGGAPILVVPTIALQFKSKLYEKNLKKLWKIESVVN